ncbi:MAG: D-glycero-beta-D-manno-heptose 1-phosphate adenylyltransferase [Saprospiraceae bacterium]
MKTAPIFKCIDLALPSIRKWKQEGLTVAFTNGCFDLLHKGHVDYLSKSSALADKLIIGLNSDESVKRLKGIGRPIQSEISRGSILAALRSVSAVIIFDEEIPLRMIKMIRPDVIIKGGDYKEVEMIGRTYVHSYGGKAIIVPFEKGYSTSGIIEKIKNF